MTRSLVSRGLGVCALLCGAALAQAEPVDEIGRLLTEKLRAVKSLSAKTHTEAEISSPGYSERRTSEGLLELARKDGKFFRRNESREIAVTQVAGHATKQEGLSLAIMDGTGYVYSYIEVGDQKTAYKTRVQVDWDANPIEGLKAAYDIELLPDDTLDGDAVYVFKLTPKPGAGGEGCAIYHFRKDCGYPVKGVHFDALGKPLMIARCTDLKLNEEISPERFVFKPPRGVEVIDVTEMTSATAPASAPAAPGETAPETAPVDVAPQTAPSEAAPQTAPAEAAPQTPPAE